MHEQRHLSRRLATLAGLVLCVALTAVPNALAIQPALEGEGEYVESLVMSPPTAVEASSTGFDWGAVVLGITAVFAVLAVSVLVAATRRARQPATS